jgi:hypothetical protein
LILWRIWIWGADHFGSWQSITFQNFIIQAGTDASLVPTDMATTNATVKFTYKNTGTFFGIHVTADPFTLSYSQLNLAAGDVSLTTRSTHHLFSHQPDLAGDRRKIVFLFYISSSID